MRSFAEKVYTVLCLIPVGKVTTYALLAKAVGSPRAARAVGTVLHHNKRLVTIPCHRVVKSDGKIGGYALGQAKKEQLLRAEGVVVERGVVDLDRYGLITLA